MRELTRPDFRLTKRGSGRPLGPTAPSCAAVALAGVTAALRDREDRAISDAATAARRRRRTRHVLLLSSRAVAGRRRQRQFSLSSVEPLVREDGGPMTGFRVSPVLVKEVSTTRIRGNVWPAARKPLVVITRKLPDQVETRMRELFDARLNLDDRPMSQAELVAAVKEADVLVPTITDRIDAALIAAGGTESQADRQFRQRRRQHRRGGGRQEGASPSPTRRTCSPKTPPT